MIYDSYAAAAKYHPAFGLKSFEMTRHDLARSSEFNRDLMVRDTLNAACVKLEQCACQSRVDARKREFLDFRDDIFQPRGKPIKHEAPKRSRPLQQFLKRRARNGDSDDLRFGYGLGRIILIAEQAGRRQYARPARRDPVERHLAAARGSKLNSDATFNQQKKRLAMV